MQRVRLNQHTLELNRVKQLPQRLVFAAGIGGVGGLGNRDAYALGIEADLGNECRCARVGLSDGATKSPVSIRLIGAVRDNLVEAPINLIDTGHRPRALPASEVNDQACPEKTNLLRPQLP